jgi:hypothetical protein
VRNVDSLDSQLVAGTRGPVEPTWSPDGRPLAYVTQAEFKKVEVASGTPQTLATGLTLHRGVAWNNDGTILFGTLGNSEGTILFGIQHGASAQRDRDSHGAGRETFARLTDGARRGRDFNRDRSGDWVRCNAGDHATSRKLPLRP